MQHLSRDLERGRPEGGPRVLDGYQTSGSSPTRLGARARSDTSSETTVHVVGLGPVGRAFVARCPRDRFRIVGLSDRSGTLPTASPARAFSSAAAKNHGTPLSADPDTLRCSLAEALHLTDPDVVFDATHTDLSRDAWHAELEECVLDPGRSLILASKDALCRRGPRWLRRYGGRLGFNAVLGGTGIQLIEDLPRLGDGRVVEIAVAGNASTTAIIRAVEDGGSLEDGVRIAGERGLLEADPLLDLTGVDAAVKLAIVTGLVSGEPRNPGRVPAVDARSLDLGRIRGRRSSGKTTRLVGRYDARDGLSLAFEELRVDHPLAVESDAVVYEYRTHLGATFRHRGAGLGAEATADAALADLRAIAGRRPRPRVLQAGGAR